jgi:hypothetical protein
MKWAEVKEGYPDGQSLQLPTIRPSRYESNIYEAQR